MRQLEGSVEVSGSVLREKIQKGAGLMCLEGGVPKSSGSETGWDPKCEGESGLREGARCVY